MGEIGEEVKRVSWLACPMVVVIMFQYLLQVISIMMVGHLGEIYLSSSAIAVSLSGVTGFSLLVCEEDFLSWVILLILYGFGKEWIFSSVYASLTLITLWVCGPESTGALWVYIHKWGPRGYYGMNCQGLTTLINNELPYGKETLYKLRRYRPKILWIRRGPIKCLPYLDLSMWDKSSQHPCMQTL